MRITIARTLKKGQQVIVNKTGVEVTLRDDAEYHVVDRIVMVTDAFDGRRYVHTEIRPLPVKTVPPAKIHHFTK